MERHDELDAWVNQRIAATDLPVEWPDDAAAWRRLDGRAAPRRHRMWLWAGAAAAVAAGAIVLPGPRALAQTLWDQMVVGRIQVWMADYDAHGAAASAFTPEIRQRPEARPVPSLDEAIRAAGFSPRLPGPEVLPALPAYSVTDVGLAVWRLRTPALRYLVSQAGGAASDVPDAWDGMAIELRIGPVIIADFDGILLLQSRPFELVKPADLDIELLYRVAFQALGKSERDARALAADLSISPALLTFMPSEERDLVREFKTRSGTGVMIEGVYGPGKIAAVWSGPDRLYAMFPSIGEVSREFVVRVANAVE
jgi:hypothetical protein